MRTLVASGWGSGEEGWTGWDTAAPLVLEGLEECIWDEGGGVEVEVAVYGLFTSTWCDSACAWSRLGRASYE